MPFDYSALEETDNYRELMGSLEYELSEFIKKQKQTINEFSREHHMDWKMAGRLGRDAKARMIEQIVRNIH